MDVGESSYWVTKAMEHIAHSKGCKVGSKAWHGELRQAIELLILARASEAVC